jgi:hypothetical protein
VRCDFVVPSPQVPDSFLPQGCKIQFHEHDHLPWYDFCAICDSGEQEDTDALPDPLEAEQSCQTEAQPCIPAKLDEVLEMPSAAPSEVAPVTALTATQCNPVDPVAVLDIELVEEVVCKTPSSSRSVRKRIKDWVKSGGKSTR